MSNKFFGSNIQLLAELLGTTKAETNRFVKILLSSSKIMVRWCLLTQQIIFALAK